RQPGFQDGAGSHRTYEAAQRGAGGDVPVFHPRSAAARARPPHRAAGGRPRRGRRAGGSGMTGWRMRGRGMVRLVAGLLAGWPSLAKPGGVRRRVPAGAVALVLGLALAGAPAAGQAAAGGAASLEVKGELAGSVLYRQQPAGGSRTLGVLSGRLDLGLRPVKGSDWWVAAAVEPRSEEHTSELQSRENLVC